MSAEFNIKVTINALNDQLINRLKFGLTINDNRLRLINNHRLTKVTFGASVNDSRSTEVTFLATVPNYGKGELQEHYGYLHKLFIFAHKLRKNLKGLKQQALHYYIISLLASFY